MTPDTAVKFAWVECATNSENYVLAIGHAEDDGNGKVKIDVLEAHVPPFNAPLVIKGFAEVLRAKGIDRVMSDRHSSHYAKQEFQRYSIAFDFAELVRGDLKREFVALMDAKKIILPQVTTNAELRQQMQNLIRKKNHGGPDDQLVACAGVALQCVGRCAPVRVIPDYV
jgi:hypothetical protein